MSARGVVNDAVCRQLNSETPTGSFSEQLGVKDRPDHYQRELGWQHILKVSIHRRFRNETGTYSRAGCLVEL